MKLPLEPAAHELRDRLIARGIPVGFIRLRDGFYALPTREDVAAVGAEFARIEAQKAAPFRDESNDCDDHAERAAAFAQEVNDANQRGKDMESALAFGTIGFASRAHALNIAVHADAILCYEPQWGLRPVDIADTEWQTCTDCSIP